jgi:hypothetical protein
MCRGCAKARASFTRNELSRRHSGRANGSRKARGDDAGPESLTTIGVYGFWACTKKEAHPGMTAVSCALLHMLAAVDVDLGAVHV